jgi:hypothetical protein
VGHRAGLDKVARGKILLSLPGIKPQSPGHPTYTHTHTLTHTHKKKDKKLKAHEVKLYQISVLPSPPALPSSGCESYSDG